MVRAVVLAAGASSRMGRPKAALPLTDRRDTLLRRLLLTATTAGIPETVVVTGASRDVVRDAAGPVDRRVRFVHNENWESGQLSSLLSGLNAPSTGRHLLEAVLVFLVDSPLVLPETVVRVVRAWRLERAPVVRPARRDDHGHPVMFDRRVFDELRAADPRVGAKAVVRAHAHEILDLPVDDPGAFFDMDTEEDYLAIRASLHTMAPGEKPEA
jgi:molybdenum cofactor cytidylyltransferase